MESGRVAIAAWVTTVIMFAMSTSSLLNDRTPAGYPAAFALAIAIAGITVRRPGPMVWGVYAAACIIGVHLLQSAELLTVPRPPEVGPLVMVQAVSMMMLAATIHWANRALARARARATEQESRARELGQSLFRARRMEAIGRLAGGIAHDFNNLLTVVTANASLLYEEPSLSQDDRESCEAIIKAAESGANLTQQLLTFGGQQVVRPQRLDLHDVIADFRAVLEHMAASAQATVDFQIQAGDGSSVKADPGRVQHAAANLVINAAHASEPGGVIEVSTLSVDLAQDRVAAHGTIRAGAYQVLRVRDVGVGMDSNTAASALEPFFTTRPTGEGSGLGLAVVHGVVSQSDRCDHARYVGPDPGGATEAPRIRIPDFVSYLVSRSPKSFGRGRRPRFRFLTNRFLRPTWCGRWRVF